MARYPNLYLKFTTNNTRAASKGKSSPQTFFETVIAAYGASRLFWGSNFPATQGSAQAPYREIVDEVRAALSFLSSQDQEWMFAGTARSLFPALVRP